MSVYYRVTCTKGGDCNTKGAGGNCSKCGEQRAGGAWWYRFRFAGLIIHESARTQSKTVAREAERRRRRELEEKYNHIPPPRTLPPTFEKAQENWLADRKKLVRGEEEVATKGTLAPATLRIDENSLKHLTPVFGKMLLCDITKKTVKDYQEKRLLEGVEGRTVNIEVKTLRQIRRANKYWPHPDGEAADLPEREDAGQALAPELESFLFEECAKSDSPCYTATVVAINTTMRKSEIRKLRWNQVDVEGVLTVGKSKTRAGTGRPIPLNPAARRALADWAGRFPDRRPDDYVFPACENGRIDPSRPMKSWRTAWRTATRHIVCPKCGRRQRPENSCSNRRCRADIHDIKNPLAGLRFHDLRYVLSFNYVLSLVLFLRFLIYFPSCSDQLG